MNGFINLYKPRGISSASALNTIKKKCKGFKVGHMGTLDPLAEGVLPVAVGKCTRLFDYTLDKVKVYIAEFTFGYQTDTLDSGGLILYENGALPKRVEVEQNIKKLVGKVSQIPPIYSAKNVGGMRSYELARKGVSVELKSKEVEIVSIKLLSCIEEKGVYNFEITCKGGTYIRSICRDLASLLNTYATMTALKRTQSGKFCVDKCVTIEEVKNCEDVSSLLENPSIVLDYDILNISNKNEQDLICGRPCLVDVDDGLYKVYNDGVFVCLGSVANKNLTIKVYMKE